MIKKIILITIITFITFGVIACSSNSGEALIDTARNGDLETAKLLIENGTDINANDKDGVTALMNASKEGNLEIVKYLVEKGANVNIKDNHGRTALDLAETEEIKKVLRKAGAK